MAKAWLMLLHMTWNKVTRLRGVPPLDELKDMAERMGLVVGVGANLVGAGDAFGVADLGCSLQ
jgi:hypothetical protein